LKLNPHLSSGARRGTERPYLPQIANQSKHNRVCRRQSGTCHDDTAKSHY
jgi:hypothetical protein